MTVKYMPFNLKWSLKEMDRVMEMASRRSTLADIAKEFNVSRIEMEELCKRNGIRVWRKA